MNDMDKSKLGAPGLKGLEARLKPSPAQMPPKEITNPDMGALFKELSSSPDGLASANAKKRLEKYGPNALEEKTESALLKFLGYFWGPIPWMIEVAAVLSAIVGHWVDLIIILGFAGVQRHCRFLAGTSGGQRR